MTGTFLHVARNGRGLWSVRKSGAKRALSLHYVRHVAIARAVYYQPKLGCSIYIHNADGSINSVLHPENKS